MHLTARIFDLGRCSLLDNTVASCSRAMSRSIRLRRWRFSVTIISEPPWDYAMVICWSSHSWLTRAPARDRDALHEDIWAKDLHMADTELEQLQTVIKRQWSR